MFHLFIFCANAQELNPLNTDSDCDDKPTQQSVRCRNCIVYFNDNGDLRVHRYKQSWLNVGYVIQSSFDRFHFPDGAPPLTANSKKGWGMNVTYGTSYTLHRTPVLSILHFGIDAVWVDFNYVKGRMVRYVDRGRKPMTRQLDLAMGVGPAVHIAAARNLDVDVYFRYNPTLATYHNESRDRAEARLGYGTMFTSGFSVAWSGFALGGEMRLGHSDYHMLDWRDRDRTAFNPREGVTNPMFPGGPIAGTTHHKVMKLRTFGGRIFLGYRF